MILINNPYYIPTKHYSNDKFCPMGIIDRDIYCTMPCFLFDSQYCTYWIHGYNQEKAVKEWINEDLIDKFN